MKHIKAIFFDIDSTIYSHRIHDVPESTKKTLYQLKKNGYKVGIATSRCQFEATHLPRFLREFDFDATIFDGGAVTLEKGNVLYKYPIAVQQIQTLLSYVKQMKVPMRYSTLEGDYFHEECKSKIKDEFFKLYLNIPIVKPYEMDEAFNVLIYLQNQEQVKEVERLLDDVAMVIHSNNIVEITAKGIDKSVAVQHMVDRWGLTRENIICFGDGANDVGMLQYAGLGIAMENGNQKAKNIADRICGHIDEDGIYHICKQLKLIELEGERDEIKESTV